MTSGSRLLPGLIRSRSCNAFTVLRLAEAGRITSSSFNLRRTGLPPSEIRFKPIAALHAPQKVLLRFREFRQDFGGLPFHCLRVHLLLRVRLCYCGREFLRTPQHRGISLGVLTFHTASTAAGYSLPDGLIGSDPNRQKWLPLSTALIGVRVDWGTIGGVHP
jgi:hypothetical protein